MKKIIASSIAALALACAPVQAQWVKVPRASIPRMPDGKPNLSATAPKLPDGKPDLSGVWGYSGYTSDIAKDYDVGELPMTPLAEKLFKEALEMF